MSSFEIYGGKRLNGEIVLESSKNAILPMLASAILTDKQVVLKNCPDILDVRNMIEILTSIGVFIKRENKDIIICAENVNSNKIPFGVAKELRSSIFMLGALLGRLGKAEITYPGGCSIGLRPIDLHLKGVSNLGVTICKTYENIECFVDKLVGNSVYLDYPSVGATENLMIAAVLAEGKTEIHNPAKEPEIVDLMNFLNSMGAKVYGAGTSIILIDGVKELHGTEYQPISDRIEAGTYLVAAAITGGSVSVKGVDAKNIFSLIDKFCDITCKINVKNDIINLKCGGMLNSFGVETGPYPAFPTDMQAQMMALACVANGVSVITENVFETRFNHVPELIKMGANINVIGRTAMIKGEHYLHGANVCAKDLRGGAALVLAGLNAEGVTTIEDAYHIERGYADFDLKLKSLGANIKKT